MAADSGYPLAPVQPPSPPRIFSPEAIIEYLGKLADYVRSVGEVANQVRQGKINGTGTVTLTANATTTTLSDKRIGINSKVFLFPTTATAATEFGAGSLRIAAANESATITHANTADTDKTFNYAILA